MSTVNETKKLVAGLGSKFSSMGSALKTSSTSFDDAAKHAQDVVRGSGTKIEEDLVAALRAALSHVEKAATAVAKASEACQTYAEQTI